MASIASYKRMFQRLNCWISVYGVHFVHPIYQIYTQIIYISINFSLTFIQHFVLKIFQSVSFFIKWMVSSTQQFEKYNPRAPNINRCAVITFIINHFWRHKFLSPIPSVHNTLVFELKLRWKSKINDFDLIDCVFATH